MSQYSSFGKPAVASKTQAAPYTLSVGPRSVTVRSPFIGRGFAFILIVGFLTWSAVRSIGARSPAAPRLPFPKPTVDETLASARGRETAVLAGGCFWGIQAVFEHLRGVTLATAGYSGGRIKSPSYEMVSSGLTGHAESVSITFDPSQITYGRILLVYFAVAHDPTQLNRQGPDTGSQYRSAVFYSNDQQKRIAEAYVAQLDAAQVYPQKIVTQIVPFEAFYRAEEYHQDYLENHRDQPYIIYNDLPKLERLKQQFPELYKK
jgi:peptide-methionine (S)-S-oxide reductase